jgi:hypothetical protein
VAKRKQARSVSRKEIAAVTRKLEAWGATLPASERAALQVLTARGRDVTQFTIPVAQARTQLSEAIQSVFVTMLKGKPEAWVKQDGPMWVKSSKVREGEEVEIISKVVVKAQNG